jgi:hypothetical protein
MKLIVDFRNFAMAHKIIASVPVLSYKTACRRRGTGGTNPFVLKYPH